MIRAGRGRGSRRRRGGLLRKPGQPVAVGNQGKGLDAASRARALLSKPRILLLDEPTEGIQPNIVDLIEEVIVGFKAKRLFTILLLEQGLKLAARLADAYVIMAKGAVVASGRTGELSDEPVKQHLVV